MTPFLGVAGFNVFAGEDVAQDAIGPVSPLVFLEMCTG